MTETVRVRKLSGEEARALAVEWLRRVGVPAPERRLRAYARALALRRRVAIATARSRSSRRCSSPTSHVGARRVSIQAQILRLLRTLDREHAGGVILVAHDLGVVAQL
jgi:ABC-type dipeptide/oligopeptide/nickel transport system ATPase component